MIRVAHRRDRHPGNAVRTRCAAWLLGAVLLAGSALPACRAAPPTVRHAAASGGLTVDPDLPPTERVRRAIARRDIAASLAALPAADVRERDALGGTLLHAAATFSGDLRLLGALLKAGAPVDARDDDDQTALHAALRHAHYAGTARGDEGLRLRAVVELLMAHGARLAPEPRPVSPDAPSLLQALLLKQIEFPFLAWLIERGLPVPDDAASAAVASADDPATVQRAVLLLKTLPAKQLRRADAQGRTIAHVAASSARRLPLLQLLHQRGVDLRAVDGQGVTVFAEAAGAGDVAMLDWLAARGALSMAADHDGDTPLHRAAMDPRPLVLAWLLQRGADPAARDRLGRQALEVAIDTRRYAFLPAPQRTALVQQLGGSPADATRGRVLQPPLYLALTSPAHDLREVARLLDQGADANVRNEDGHTPLLHALQGISTLPNTPATREFCRKVLPLLLRHGADPRRIHDPWAGRTYVELARELRVSDDLEREMRRANR